MTNKITIKPEPSEVSYGSGTFLISDSDTVVEIPLGWKAAENVSHDYLIELDDKEFKNFIKKIEEERNE